MPTTVQYDTIRVMFQELNTVYNDGKDNCDEDKDAYITCAKYVTYILSGYAQIYANI